MLGALEITKKQNQNKNKEVPEQVPEALTEQTVRELLANAVANERMNVGLKFAAGNLSKALRPIKQETDKYHKFLRDTVAVLLDSTSSETIGRGPELGSELAASELRGGLLDFPSFPGLGSLR